MASSAGALPDNNACPVAIVGGGISGLAAAYELARRGADFTLFEKSNRLGGIIETRRAGNFIIECGPDGWVTEKPWARELLSELGIENQIIHSNDPLRRTYLVREENGNPGLVPIPDGMRMMVPTLWRPLLTSPLLSWKARWAFLREPSRAAFLKRSAPDEDESVAQFVIRHFGDEVTESIARPLLSGVLGGDVDALSVRAVLPAFVSMEAASGSLIKALKHRRTPGPPQPLFSTLKDGLESMVQEVLQVLPEHSIRLETPVLAISYDNASDGFAWQVETAHGPQQFRSLVLATPADTSRNLLACLGAEGHRMADLLPTEASSAIIAAFAFDPLDAGKMKVPRGFGFLGSAHVNRDGNPQLLACTFMDQKFPLRAPPGSTLLRAFFGGPSAEKLLNLCDDEILSLAKCDLDRILGPLPRAVVSLVSRLPRSLPQYSVGHAQRITSLETMAANWRGLQLLGNAYHGVGLPDLIREGRNAARSLLDEGNVARA